MLGKIRGEWLLGDASTRRGVGDQKRRGKFIGSRRRFGAAVAAVAMAMAFTIGESHAIPLTFTQNLSFVAPTQSQWSPGGSVTQFGSGPTTFGSSFGIEFETKASTGSVQSTVNGTLSAAYNNLGFVTAPTQVNTLFTGATSQWNSFVGAFLNLKAFLNINFPSPIPDVNTKFCLLGAVGANPSKCLNYALDIAKNFTPVLGTNTSAMDSLTVLSPGVSVGIVSAGVDLDLDQTGNFKPKAVLGNLVATNNATGATRTAPLTIDDLLGDLLSLNLDVGGLWTLNFQNLMLDNDWFTNFALSAVPFIEYIASVGCGDAGTDSDNGILCPGIADGRASFNLASISLLNTQTFALAFNSLSTSSFQITVVPEPATLFVFGFGLLGLGAMTRRKSKAA